jgi:Zn-dependent protease
MFSKGYLTIGRLGGAPIRIHWSTPIGMLVFTGFLRDPRFAPGLWLGFLLVVLVHELGHAIAVWLSGHRVVAVDAYALGGLCHWRGGPSPLARAMIAWGGVIAQAALAIGTSIALAFLGRPAHVFTADLAHAFVDANLWMALMNLVPVPPLDGAEAWRVVPILAARRRRRRENEAARARAAAAAKTSLRALDEPDELPPLPDEVKRVLDRVMSEGRAQSDAEKKAK